MLCSCRKLTLLCAIILTCFGTSGTASAQVAGSDQLQADAVRAAAKSFLAAVARGDEAGLQRLWAVDGDFIDANGKKIAAGELNRSIAAAATKDASPTFDGMADVSVRLLTPEVAIVDGLVDRVSDGNGGVLTRKYTAVWVNKNGAWLLSSLRTTAVDAFAQNSHLKPLEWLLGEWVAKHDDAAIIASARWCDDGHFILREFAIARDNGDTISGTQRIGWDPTTKQIKSWTFDSQGGIGQEQWRREGNRWIVESADVTADGKKAKTSTAYIPGDGGRFTWEVTSADVDGVQLKPKRIEFHRAKADK